MGLSFLSILAAGLLAVGNVNAAAAGQVCTSTHWEVGGTTTYTVLATAMKTITPKAATATVVVNGTTTYTEDANSIPASSTPSSSVVLSSSTSVARTSSSISVKSSSSTSNIKAKRAATACTSTRWVTATRLQRVTTTKTVTSTITAAQSTVTTTSTVLSKASSSSTASSKPSSSSTASSKSSSSNLSSSKASSSSSSSSNPSSSKTSSTKPLSSNSSSSKSSSITTASTTSPAVGPTCTARNQLTDITSDCASTSKTPYCAIFEGGLISGSCMSCVPLNHICTTSSQCCDGFSCSPHGSNDFGYCRPYSANPTGLSAAPSSSTSTGKTSSSTNKITTSTKTSSTTAAASSTAKAQSCDIDEVSDGTSTWLYAKYYTGSGYTLSPTNSGNSANGFPPVTTTLAGSMSECQAVAACAQSAVEQADNYWSFGLWMKNGGWTCVMYVNGNDDTGAWNVTDAGVSKALGFSVHGV